MKTASNGKKRPREYQKHGLYTAKAALNGRGLKAIDGRTEVGRALARWRADLVQDLGGRGTISTQQAALIDLAVKSKLLLDSIDSWLLTQPSLINQRKKALLPVCEREAAIGGRLGALPVAVGSREESPRAERPGPVARARKMMAGALLVGGLHGLARERSLSLRFDAFVWPSERVL